MRVARSEEDRAASAGGTVEARVFEVGRSIATFLAGEIYDFNVYSSRKKREKLEYMQANPVKRGLVKNPAELIWSSYLFYSRGEIGLIEMDPVE